MAALRNLRIGTRLWLLLSLDAMTMTAIVVWLILDTRATAMEEKRLATRQVVELAHSTLKHVEALVHARPQSPMLPIAPATGMTAI
jgi:hypothetical protein